MPFRFYRRRRIAPGIRLNLSKGGPSLTLGGRGFHYTVGAHRHRTTVGIPGSGLYHTSYSRAHARSSRGRGRAKGGTSATSQAMWPDEPHGPSSLSRLIRLFTRTGRARRLLDRAHDVTDPLAGRRLIERAALLAPGLPEVVGAQAAWAVTQAQWLSASSLYARYLTAVPADHAARAQYARCLLMAGYPDGAIEQLVLLRGFTFDEDGTATLTSLMSIGFLMKGDAEQALALLAETSLRTHVLSPALQQCLHLRAAAHFMLGKRARAIADVDRLWALNPSDPEVAADKAAMMAGTYRLETPAGPVGPQGLDRVG